MRGVLITAAFLAAVPVAADGVRIDITEPMPVELLLHTLGQSYGVNIIVAPDVKGNAPILSLKHLTFQLGLVYGNLKAYGQGIEMMKTLVKRSPDHQLADDALYLAGYYCLCLERYQGAKKAFELLMKTYPASPRAQWAAKDMQMMKEKGLGEETGNVEKAAAQEKPVSVSPESQPREDEHYHKRKR